MGVLVGCGDTVVSKEVGATGGGGASWSTSNSGAGGAGGEAVIDYPIGSSGFGIGDVLPRGQMFGLDHDGSSLGFDSKEMWNPEALAHFPASSSLSGRRPKVWVVLVLSRASTGTSWFLTEGLERLNSLAAADDLGIIAVLWEGMVVNSEATMPDVENVVQELTPGIPVLIELSGSWADAKTDATYPSSAIVVDPASMEILSVAHQLFDETFTDYLTSLVEG